MRSPLKSSQARTRFGHRWTLGRAILAGGLLLALAASAAAQGFNLPWEEDDEPPRPAQREPAYRPPAQPVPPPQTQPQAQQQPGGAWGTKNPICLQLEQRLVQEGQRGSQSRSVLPQLEQEIRALDETLHRDSDQLERRCYEYFLFVKSLRNNPQCRDLSRQVDANKRRLADLETQRQSIVGSGGRTYQDDIISELARNNCGATYQQQARQREGGFTPGFWQDDSEGGPSGGGLGTYGNLGYATYRTLCVRLCDGYYFPVSFSTLPNHFSRDQEVCQSKCAAPVELYYYQNPGGAIDQMISVSNNETYTKLNTAFRYRKEYVKGCSCKKAEYTQPGAPPAPGTPVAPDSGAPAQQGAAPPASPAATAKAPPAPPAAAAQAQPGEAGGSWDAEAQPQ